MSSIILILSKYVSNYREIWARTLRSSITDNFDFPFFAFIKCLMLKIYQRLGNKWSI